MDTWALVSTSPFYRHTELYTIRSAPTGNVRVGDWRTEPLVVLRGPISLRVANSRSAFDSAAHFHGGETTNLTLPTAISANSLVYLGPDLVLARFTLKGIFGERFIPSTFDTSEREKAPMSPCARHKRLLVPEGHETAVRNFTAGPQPMTRVGQQHLVDRHQAT